MRFILDFVQDTPQDAIDAYLAGNNCTIVSVLNQLGLVYLVDSNTTPVANEIVEIVADNPNGVELLSTAETKTFAIQDDENWWKLAVIPEIDLDGETATIMRRGQGIRVYLMDSGIMETHPDFVGKDITLVHSKTGEFSDTTGHGTALASVIIGETCGITEASLKVVKIFEENHPTLVSEILTALNAIGEDFDQDPTSAAILNMSWGIAKNEYVEAKILSLIAKGFVAVAAAGNSGTAVGNITPASLDPVVTVGSFGQDLTPSDFSNYTGPSDTSLTNGQTNFGPGLDLFAPGETIRVAKIDGTYGYTAGTSISAAITSALTAINIYNSYQYFDYRELDSFNHFAKDRNTTANLLTLDGVYANSPNLIPRARVKEFDPATDTVGYYTRTFGIESGKTFSINLYEKIYIASVELLNCTLPGAYIQDGRICGTMPMVENYTHYVGRYRATQVDGTVVENDLSFYVYNPELYADSGDFRQNSGIELYLGECGCMVNFCCCLSCDSKSNTCGNCYKCNIPSDCYG